MPFGRPDLPILHRHGKTVEEDRKVRVKSPWTPGSIALWLIAAILATLVVCSQVPPAPKPSAGAGGAEVEVQIVE
jgi:hypothetical protein